jgi:tetratricopeptide (TPR) repeat protein
LASGALFSSSNLIVRSVPARDETRLVVTFDNYHDFRTLDRKGFGEDFLADLGVSAIHVLSRDNDWFQYQETAPALEAIRIAADGRRVMTYGSSMGGYAAIRFADAVGAKAALALSPQYSVDVRKAPFEDRWGQDMRRIRFRPELERPIACAFYPVVVYDPTDIDRLHADRIDADTPIVRIRAPHAGHPAGALLAESGLLRDVVLRVLEGSLDAAETEKAIRVNSRRMGGYLSGLAEKQPAVRPRLAVALARKAVALCPERIDLKFKLANRLTAAGAHDEALALHEAVASAHRHPVFLFGYSKSLLTAGEVDRALGLALEIRDASPTVAGFHAWIGEILESSGRFAEALPHAWRAYRLDPKQKRYRSDVLRLNLAAGRQRLGLKPKPRPA